MAIASGGVNTTNGPDMQRVTQHSILLKRQIEIKFGVRNCAIIPSLCTKRAAGFERSVSTGTYKRRKTQQELSLLPAGAVKSTKGQIVQTRRCLRPIVKTPRTFNVGATSGSPGALSEHFDPLNWRLGDRRCSTDSRR